MISKVIISDHLWYMIILYMMKCYRLTRHYEMYYVCKTKQAVQN
jgi:hypothetical protein